METTLAARTIEPQPHTGEKPEDHGHRTRRCTACGDWLCRWNGGTQCYRHHSVPRYRMVDDFADLAALMEEAA